MNPRKALFSLSLLALLTSNASAHSHFAIDGIVDIARQIIEPRKPQYRPGSLREEDAVALYSPEQRISSFSACADLFPGGHPINPKTVLMHMNPLALCSDHFAVLYSQTSKTPLIVVERLTAAQLLDAKGEVRTNQFYADPRIPKNARAEPSDYRGATPAMDQGHQAPAGDAPNPRSMGQSFALSNMVPQNPTNNREAWRKVEADVRKFARRTKGSVFVFTGPLFDPGHKTIGRNRVWVPDRLFKLVYDEPSRRAWAYVLPNTADAMIERPMSYEAFVGATNLDLLQGLPVESSIAPKFR